jgi:outer membrane protein
MICRILVILLAVTPVATAAQEPLTVNGAVKAAVAHNASLRAAHAGVEEAKAQAAQARSAFFPRVLVAESWQRGNDPVFVFSSLLSARRFAASNFAIDALNHPNPIGFFRTSVGVDQVLFDGGRSRSATTAATLGQTIAEASADEAAGALAVTTTQAFGRVLTGDAARRTAEAGLAAAREDLSRAERRRDEGMTTDADVLALVVHVADLQQRAIEADGQAATARAELNQLMGNPIDAVLDLIEPSSPPVNEPGDRPNVTALLAEAEAARPELKRVAASEHLGEAVGRQARAALIPQLAAQAAVDVSGTSLLDRTSAWIVGGELRWTLSTGGAEVAAMKAAAARLARARAERDDTRATVQVEVVSALHRLETARARQAVGHATVDQARESQRIIRDRFDAGLAPVNDVLRASTAVIDADANRVAAVIDAMVATAMLNQALGRAP